MQRLLLVFLSYFLLITSLTLNAKTLTVISGEWPPLISSSLADDGPISQIVKESFAMSGLSVNIEYRPWKRAMREVSLGQVDAGFAWRKTPDREKGLLFSDEIYEGLSVFFHLKATPFTWLGYKDLDAYRVGAALGYIYSKEFEESEKQGVFSVYRVSQEKNLLNMLLAKRIDVFPGNREVIHHLVKAQHPYALEQIVYDPLPLSSKPLYLVVKPTPQGRELLKQFNAGLAKLKASGRYQVIYKALSD